MTESNLRYGTPCMICCNTIETEYTAKYPLICEECKMAIRWAKLQMHSDFKITVRHEPIEDKSPIKLNEKAMKILKEKNNGS